MLKMYFLTAFRRLRRNRLLYVLNIIGLAIGILTFLLIMQFVWFEKSYDTFHDNAENIYRIALDEYSNDKLVYEAPHSPFPLAGELKDNFSQVAEFARVVIVGKHISYKDKTLYGKIVYHVDPSFLTMFSFPLIKGEAKSALQESNSVVLSESMAKDIFGDEEPMNKVISLTYPGEKDYIVKGIFKDIPKNTHFKFKILLSIKRFENRFRDNWMRTPFFTYLLLQPNTDPKALEVKMNELSQKRASEKLKKQNMHRHYYLQPLKDIHLHSNLHNEIETLAVETFHYLTLTTSSYKSVDILFYVAVLILIFAWINYSNLSYVKSLERAREVGLRKVVGADRTGLIFQFVSESLFVNIIGVILAIVLFMGLMPWFNQYTGLPASHSIFKDSRFLLFFPALIVVGTFLSSLASSLFLSSLKPEVSLRGQYTKIGRGRIIIKGLIVIQFLTTVILLCSTSSIAEQIKFVQSKDLGFKREQIIMIPHPFVFDKSTQYEKHIKTFKDEMKKIAGVANAASSWPIPGSDHLSTKDIRLADDPRGPQANIEVKSNQIDSNFLDTYQIKLLAGRTFFDKVGTDSNCVLINEKCLEILGFKKPKDAVGKILMADKRKSNKQAPHEIIGVVQDYHQESLKKPIKPTLFIRHIDPDADGAYALKINTTDFKWLIAQIEAKFHEIFPGNTFNYYFLDEVFQRLYQPDIQFGEIVGMFTMLAIVICYLGLLGMASYTSIQRTKEIGIRKVLGADVKRILQLFSWDFLKLLGIAIILALPTAYFLMNKWLENFNYRITIEPMLMIIPTFFILIITLVVVNLTVFKVANTNPTKSMRYE